MNYSKKHLKHIWYKYFFGGSDFKTLGGVFSHDRMALLPARLMATVNMQMAFVTRTSRKSGPFVCGSNDAPESAT